MLSNRVPFSIVSTIVALAAAWSLAAEASAAPRDRVGVVIFPIDDDAATAAAFVSHLFRQVTANYAVTELNEGLDAASSASSMKAIEKADAMVSKGARAIVDSEASRAVPLLKKAIGTYEREAGAMRETFRVSRAMMLLGAAHLLLLEDKPALDNLASAAMLEPDIAPNSRFFSPAMAEMFEEAKDELEARPTVTLAINSQPAGAQVYVDGVFRGVTPLTVEELPEGHHWIRMIAGGYRPWGKVVRAKGRGEFKVSAKLKAAPSRSAYNTLVNAVGNRLSEGGEEAVASRAVVDAVLRFGGAQRLNRLMLVGVEVDGDELVVYAGNYHITKKRAGWETLTFPFETSLGKIRRQTVQVAKTLFDSDPPALIDPDAGGLDESATSDDAEADVAIAAEPADDSPEAPAAKAKQTEASSGPGMRIILGVGLIAGGVVMMGLGGLFWGLGNADHDAFNQSEQIDAPDLADGGNTKAIAGDVLFFTGLVFTAGGILAFIFLPKEKTGPKQEYDWGGQQSFESNLRFILGPTDGGAHAGLRVAF